jgi:RNA polymerase sigma factor (sigma-70 family)
LEPASDRDLVLRFLERRDEEAFRLLFRRHSPRLFGLALRLVGGRRADAEDAVQETWRRAARQLPAFEWRSSLSTWLHGVAINCVREGERRRSGAPIDGTQDADAAEAVGHRPDLAIDLAGSIAALPPRARQVIVLHDVEGYTHAEIAKLLGIAVGTSKRALFDARHAVRRFLTPDSEDATDD